jgi:predicted secreted Zn-dependent protease
MTSLAPKIAAALSLLCAAMPAHAEWQAVERVQTYAISGNAPIDLYMSIGANGPKVGIGRAIAYTDFELLWSRDYVPASDGSCTLQRARPSLTITYRLPKPTNDLPAATRPLWQTFIDGVEAHERVHGDFIKHMVREIEAVSVGLRAENDPNCSKVREQLQVHLGRLSQEQRQKSRDFDLEELTEGGNVHQLVLSFVNGDRLD